MALSRVGGAVVDVRHRPALLVLCGIVGAGEAATWLFLVPFLGDGSTVTVLGLLLVQRAALLALLAALLPGCYAAARADHGSRNGPAFERGVGGIGAAFKTALDRGRADGRPVLVSMVASRAVVLGLTVPIALVLVGALGVVDTAVVWIEAYVGVGTDRTLLATLGVAGAILLPSLLARGAVGLHDLAAIDGNQRPWLAPLWSLRAWRGLRRGVLGYSVVRGVLLATPLGAAALVVRTLGDGWPLLGGGSDPGALALAFVTFVATTAVARSVLACYDVEAYERATAAASVSAGEDETGDGYATADEGRADHDRTIVPGGRRVTVAVLVLVAAIAGAAVVRVADVHPQPDDAPDGVVPENARATVETAIERTAARDRFLEQRTEIRNPSGQWVTVNRFEALLDRSDRQLMFYGHVGPGSDAGDRTIYATDGRLASLRSAAPPAPAAPHYLRFERGSWSVLVGPPYGWAIEEPTRDPPANAGWRLAEATGDRLVYRLQGAPLDEATFRDLVAVSEDRDIAMGEGARVTLVVDRETHTVRRMSARATLVGSDSADGETRLRWERRVNWLGDVEVDRPNALPSPSVLALFWDAVYY